jgi:3-oxoacyl-[acyl-carrier protein] reductase
VPYPVAQMPTGEWEAVIDTNLKGTFLSNRAVLRPMIRQRSGTIVNISSSPGGYQGQAFASAYCASKFGVAALSAALAEEVTGFGVRIQVLFPDAIDTPLLEKTTLSARLGTPLPPARVADLIVYMIALPEDTALLDPVILPSRLPDESVPD